MYVSEVLAPATFKVDVGKHFRDWPNQLANTKYLLRYAIVSSLAMEFSAARGGGGSGCEQNNPRVGWK